MQKKNPKYVPTNIYLNKQDADIYDEIRNDAKREDVKLRKLLSNIVTCYIEGTNNIKKNAPKEEVRIIIEEELHQNVKNIAKAKKVRKGDIVAEAFRAYKESENKEMFFR